MTYIAENRFHGAAAGTTGLRQTLGQLLLRAGTVINLWYERGRQRRDLARLDDRLLRDIGIDRATVEQEILKPFWRP